MAKRLNRLGIDSVYELAQANPHLLQETFGVMGLQLYAHSWGLIVPFREKAQHKAEKSFGNSQILPRDYARRDQIELVLKELTEQVVAV